MNNNKKQTLIINKNEFINWRFSDGDDYECLAQIIINIWKDNVDTLEANVHLYDIIKETGYIPEYLVLNYDELDLTEYDLQEGERLDEFDFLEDYDYVFVNEKDYIKNNQNIQAKKC